MQDKVSGKRIMGMTPQNSIATMVASKPHALWDVPANWTLAQAATVPVAYATAYDALVVRGRLQPHHRVLIHSATGAVGLAATRICLNRGCEVRGIFSIACSLSQPSVSWHAEFVQYFNSCLLLRLYRGSFSCNCIAW